MTGSLGIFMFTSTMYLALVWCLIWLLTGGAHRSAHPNGERPQLLVLTPLDPGLAHEPPRNGHPRCVVIIGRMYARNAWGLRILWGLIEPEPEPWLFMYRHEFAIGREITPPRRNPWFMGHS